MTAPRRVLLVDNGSLEAASTLQLRHLAKSLSERLAVRVDPVSLAHSDRIAPENLGGRRAELFDAALDRALAEGAEELVVLPLFIGPSYAIVRHLPALLVERRKRFPHARIALADPLFVAGETRLGDILADFVIHQLSIGPAGSKGANSARVTVVDHGSPSRAVAQVRDCVAAQVRDRLGDRVREVVASSMERRPGAEFDFNEPQLATLLRRDGWRDGPLVVALLFIAPGRHAGPGGDVATIVAEARGAQLGDVAFTPVMGLDPRLIDILRDRAAAVFSDSAKAVERPLVLRER